MHTGPNLATVVDGQVDACVGLRNDEGGFRRTRPSEVLLPIIVGISLSYAHSEAHSGQSVGRPKHPRVMAGALEGDTFIGRRAQEYRGLLKIKYPIEHGIVTDWEDMERIWNWVYTEELGTLSEEVCRSLR